MVLILQAHLQFSVILPGLPREKNISIISLSSYLHSILLFFKKHTLKFSRGLYDIKIKQSSTYETIPILVNQTERRFFTMPK